MRKMNISRASWIAAVAVLVTFVVAMVTACEEPPGRTCEDQCQLNQPEECEGGSALVMVTEFSDEEPLAVGDHWMCGCPSKNGHLILHLTPRRACKTPREWTAYDIRKRAPSDD